VPALNSSPTNRLSVAVILALLGVGVVRTAQAGSGRLGLDHPVPYDDAGIWKRSNQLLLIDSMLVGEVGLGLWEGGESRFGRTIWQSIDASAVDECRQSGWIPHQPVESPTFQPLPGHQRRQAP
jgi:hypothetical protein